MYGISRKHNRKDSPGSLDTQEPTITPESPEQTIGRPTVYSDEVADLILRRLAGGESLRKICQSEGMPARSTVMLWHVNDTPPGFSDRYARAREAQASIWADEIVDVADDIKADNDPKSRQVRVDARKWVASRILRPIFGDKVDVMVSDPDKVLAEIMGCKVEDLPE